MSSDSEPARSVFEIKSIAFGLKFQPRWKIIDKLGDILDCALFAPGTAFGPDVFPRHHTSGTQRILVGQDETNNSLMFSERELLLRLEVDTTEHETISNLASHFQKYAVDQMIEAGMNQVIRYGFLIRLAECSDQLADLPSTRFLGDDSPVNAMNLSFTRRAETNDARFVSGDESFCNLIYIVNQTTDAHVQFGLDYQQVFAPPLNRKEIEKKPFQKFVLAGLKYYDREFSRWLRKFMHSEAA